MADGLENGQDKRERFAGAGLRGCDQVASGQRGLNGQSLDGGGVDKAVLGEIAPEGSGKGSSEKLFIFGFADENRRADYR
jgi:hypothetical protein